MDVILSLVTKPFSLVSLIFLAGVRSVSLATLAWWHLVRGIVNFHVDLCWKVLIWIIALVSLPVRIFTALQRERAVKYARIKLGSKRIVRRAHSRKKLEKPTHHDVSTPFSLRRCIMSGSVPRTESRQRFGSFWIV